MQRLREPRGEGVRFDGGLREGLAVTAAFDSMLAKLITAGASRDESAARMRAALRDFVLLGVDHNADYLSRIFAHETFLAGQLHTGFVVEHAESLAPAPLAPTERAAVLIAAALAADEFRQLAYDCPEPHASIGAWRN